MYMDLSHNIYDEEACVICFDNNNLIDNFFCDCSFKFHRDCYLEWLSNKENNCIVCNRSISELYLKGLSQINKSILEIQDKGKENLLSNNLTSDEIISLPNNSEPVCMICVLYKMHISFILLIFLFIIIILLLIYF